MVKTTTTNNQQVLEAFDRLIRLAEQRDLDAVFHIALITERDRFADEEVTA